MRMTEHQVTELVSALDNFLNLLDTDENVDRASRAALELVTGLLVILANVEVVDGEE